mgnify:CR=1 FL=1
MPSTLRAFHAAYYRPDNAVLVVSGNFTEAQLDGYVKKYFAGIKTPDRAIPRVTAVEPPRTEAKSYTVYEPNVSLPAVAVSWPQPDANSPDIASAATSTNTIPAARGTLQTGRSGTTALLCGPAWGEFAACPLPTAALGAGAA